MDNFPQARWRSSQFVIFTTYYSRDKAKGNNVDMTRGTRESDDNCKQFSSKI
jgi:hypothetical protein